MPCLECCLITATIGRRECTAINQVGRINVFGDKVRKLRKTNGYSLRQLAPKVGVGFMCLSKIECGKLDFGESPSASLIHRLADALESDEDELMLAAKRVPDSIASRIFEHPDVFLKLAKCDENEFSRLALELSKRDQKTAKGSSAVTAGC